MDPFISAVIGSTVLIWLTGYCAGKVWCFIHTIYKKATGTF